MNKPKKDEPDGTVLRLIGLFWQYYLSIQARASEGRAVALRSLAAVLRRHGSMKVEYLGAKPEQPYNPETGEGYLLVDERYLVDIHIERRELKPKERQKRLEIIRRSAQVYLLDFNGRLPVWYPREVPDAPANRKCR